MKLSDTPGIINEVKLKEYVEKYNSARKLADKYLYDTEYVILVVDALISKGVISNVDKTDNKVWNSDLECFTPYYAMYIWREVALPVIGIDYETYQAIGALNKMKMKV